MKKLFAFLYIITAFSAKADYWTQKANFPGICRNMPFCFSLGNKGYVGSGRDSNLNMVHEFWEYDQTNNTWSQLANFPGAAIYGSATFSLLNKGYVVCGSGLFNFYSSLWVYDPILNTWTQRASFGGGVRFYPVGFSIGNFGYVGTGGDDVTYMLYNDLWQYDPLANVWTQKSSFAGSPRTEAIGFSIGNNGYIGTGTNTAMINPLLSDLWEYDPLSNSWIQKANLPPGGRADEAAFSLGNKGYIGIGDQGFSGPFLNDLWEYDPVTNQWTQKMNVPGMGRDEAAFFIINCKGYIGIGGEDNNPFYDDFWEYTPDSACATGIEEIANDNFQFTISPNPAHQYAVISWQSAENKNAELLITTLEGKKVYETKLLTSDLRLPTSDFPKGIYLVQIISNKKISATRKLMVE